MGGKFVPACFLVDLKLEAEGALDEEMTDLSSSFLLML